MDKLAIIIVLGIFVGCKSASVEESSKVIELSYNNGKVAVTGTLLGENEKVGEWKIFFPDGKIYIRVNYDKTFEDYFKLYQEYNQDGRLIQEARENENGSNNHFNHIKKFFSDVGVLNYEIITDIYVEFKEEGDEHYIYETVNEYYSNGSLMTTDKYTDYELEYSDWYDTLGDFQGRVYNSNSIYKVERSRK